MARAKLSFSAQGKEWTVADATSRIQQIMSVAQYGVPFPPHAHEFMMDIFKYHPEFEQKIGAGVKHVRTMPHPIFRTPMLEIVREDGSVIDISYKQCLKASPDTRRQDMMRAFRHAILDQTVQFKKAAYGKKKYVRCAVTNLNVRQSDCHVDHEAPLTFDALVCAFLQEQTITVGDVPIAEHGAYKDIGDEAIRRDWRAYHQEHARLRILLDKANLGQKKTKVSWELVGG